MHIHTIENGDGNNVIPFCCDACHLSYCSDHDLPYPGWNGCHEGGDSTEYCAQCGVVCHAGDDVKRAGGEGGMNRAFPYTSELKPFQDADDAWSEELQRVFGKRAGDARYLPEGKGAEGSALRRLHDAREAARRRWHASTDHV